MTLPVPFPNPFDSVQIVATDMDGTLTRNGQFSAQLIEALETLQRANILVVIVTGRSAGWVQSVVNYLPVWGAIAENGGVFFAADGAQQVFPLIDNIGQHRQQLSQTFQRCQVHFPSLKESTDNQFRLTDWTFNISGLGDRDLEILSHLADVDLWSFTYSTVQCHIKPRGQNKAIALQQLLAKQFPDIAPTAVVTVGDSPNDESLFDRNSFPTSVGVSNVKHYLGRLQHHPTYITDAPEVEGFCELVHALV